MPRLLHILSQRPGRTGSGVTLEALSRHAAAFGWQQAAVIGVPAEDPGPAVGDLPAAQIFPLVFERGALDFPLPGMSDVMPYRSTVFSRMTGSQLDTYARAWREHLAGVLERFKPDLIHSHHVWLLSSLIKDLAPDVPVVTHCHATGLRQMQLCPQLAARVRGGCARNERFCVLHSGHARELSESLGISPDRVHVVGAGFREEVFHPPAQATARGNTLVYAGKYSHAKGLPWLLDALDAVAMRHPDLVLHVAGTGAGPEAAALEARMRGMAPRVQLHGQLSQPELAQLMRRCAVFALPSFYEGLPLVLIEALACGCRPLCTRLPGVVEELLPRLGDALELVPLPRLQSVDQPVEADLPGFVASLQDGLERALQRGQPEAEAALANFGWRAACGRVHAVWQALLPADRRPPIDTGT